MTQPKTKGVRLTLDSGLYPVEAIQAAAYALSDRAHARLGRKNGAGIEVRLKAKDGGDPGPALQDQFYDELLHQALRLKISEANHKIREYVITKALVSAQTPGEPPPALPRPEAKADAPCAECVPTGGQAGAAGEPGPGGPPPVDPELEKEIAALLAEIEKSDSADDDPLGVVVAWEEKNRAKASSAGRPPDAPKKEKPS